MTASQLKRQFYSAFDHSHVCCWLKGQSMPQGLTYLGAGTHFEVWKYAASPISLVYKKADDDFWDPATPNSQHFISALRALKKSRAPLIPPFEIVEQDDKLAIVMPFAESVSGTKFRHPLLEECFRELKRHNLAVNDVIQGGECMGEPFIYDFSDLHFISR